MSGYDKSGFESTAEVLDAVRYAFAAHKNEVGGIEGFEGFGDDRLQVRLKEIAVECIGNAEQRAFKWGKERGFKMISWYKGTTREFNEQKARMLFFKNVRDINEREYRKYLMMEKLRRIGRSLVRKGLATEEDVEGWVHICANDEYEYDFLGGEWRKYWEGS